MTATEARLVAAIVQLDRCSLSYDGIGLVELLLRYERNPEVADAIETIRNVLGNRDRTRN